MANLMFVHGAAANEESWFDVPDPFIEEKDDEGNALNNVEVVRLKGHDRKLGEEPDFSVTMEDYLGSIDKAMNGLDDWVLIGHSMGGMVISQFAASFPDRVSKLIYVTAVLPHDGATVASVLGLTDSQAFLDFLVRVKAEFDNHSDPRISGARASQPPGPLNEPFRQTPAFEKISRYYIYCEDDGVILPDQQRKMVEDAVGGRMKTTEHSIFADHIPQLSAPAELVSAIRKGIGSN